MLKPLREEQADMKARWSDPAYRWSNDSNLRRQFHADTLQAPRHEVEQPHSGGSEEIETKGEPK